MTASTPVSPWPSDARKGRLSIDFASVEDLNRIIALMAPEVRKAFSEG